MENRVKRSINVIRDMVLELGQIRSKLGSLPIPGNDVTLNGAALISEGKD